MTFLFRRRFFSVAFCALAFTLSAALPASAYAQSYSGNADEGAPSARQPLVIIRYNQPHVYFERAMKTAVQKALSIKPDAQFSVLQVLPSADTPRANNARGKAKEDLAKVVAALRDSGVRTNALHISQQNGNESQYDEVYIFVE